MSDAVKTPMEYIAKGERMPDEMFEAWVREPCPKGADPHDHLCAILARTLFETRRARRCEIGAPAAWPIKDPP